MSYTALVASVALVHLLAISSPGPTFIVVSRYAAAGDHRAGQWVALGVVLATLTWSAFAATGLGAIATHHPAVYRGVQLAGALYLGYLGAKLVIGFFRRSGRDGAEPTASDGPRESVRRAVLSGYLTTLANPKVIAYYTSLFGVMLPSEPSRWQFLAVVATVVCVSALWWSGIAWLFSLSAVRTRFLRARRGVDLVMGLLLLGFALRLLLTV
jgi:threonine efflux protein